jgi:hypothetical protein
MLGVERLLLRQKKGLDQQIQSRPFEKFYPADAV